MTMMRPLSLLVLVESLVLRQVVLLRVMMAKEGSRISPVLILALPSETSR